MHAYLSRAGLPALGSRGAAPTPDMPISHVGGNAGCAGIKADKAAAKKPAPSGYYDATFFGNPAKVYCDMSGPTKTYLVLPSTATTTGQVMQACA